MPCLSTLAPWQPYFFGRGGDPAAGFDWTYHFFWGIRAARRRSSSTCGTRSRPTRSSGCCARTTRTATPCRSDDRLPGRRRGRRIHARRPRSLPDRQRRLLERHRPVQGRGRRDRVSASRSRPTSPRSGPRPSSRTSTPRSSRWPRRCCSRRPSRRSATVGDGLASEVWWTPTHPFSSSLTGVDRAGVGRRVHGGDGQAVDAVRRVRPRPARGVPRQRRPGRQHRQAGVDRRDRGDQPRHHRRHGHVRRQADLPKNVSPTPLVGGQWQQQDAGAPFPFELLVVNNTQATRDPRGRHDGAARGLTSGCRGGAALGRPTVQAVRRPDRRRPSLVRGRRG